MLLCCLLLLFAAPPASALAALARSCHCRKQLPSSQTNTCSRHESRQGSKQTATQATRENFSGGCVLSREARGMPVQCNMKPVQCNEAVVPVPTPPPW